MSDTRKREKEIEQKRSAKGMSVGGERGNESQCRCCMYVGFDDGMRFWWKMKMCFLMVWLLERVVFRVTDFLLSTQLASSKVEE